jgi:hypothetical protein
MDTRPGVVAPRRRAQGVDGATTGAGSTTIRIGGLLPGLRADFQMGVPPGGCIVKGLDRGERQLIDGHGPLRQAAADGDLTRVGPRASTRCWTLPK